MSSASSSALMQAIDPNTSFPNMIGVYSAENQTVTWTADNGIRIVSYISGRSSVLTFPQYEKGYYLGMIVAIAEETLRQDNQGVFSQTVVYGTWPFKSSFNWHVFFDPRLTPIVTSFTRYPQVEDSAMTGAFNPTANNDLSTPYDSSSSRATLENKSLLLSTFGLPPEPYVVVCDSIRDYFRVWNEGYQDWAEFADEKYFKPWSSDKMFIEGYSSFSSMIWATVSHHILGIPDAEFADHAHVWNTLLQSTKGLPSQALTKLWHFPKLEAYVLKKIRQVDKEFAWNPDDGVGFDTTENIIHYWIRNGTVDQVVEKLPHSLWAHALEIAEKKGITLKEMILLDNFFGVMIEMQEKMAFVLTQIAYHFAGNRILAGSCQGNKDACIKMVRETLRFLPPAPTSRSLRWDTDIVDKEKGKIYRANKGDLFVTMPMVTMQLKEFNPDPQLFNIDRASTHPLAFGEGPHRCPGQIPALNWLYELTFTLAKYDFTRLGESEPEYFIDSILRDGGMKFRIAPLGHIDEENLGYFPL